MEPFWSAIISRKSRPVYWPAVAVLWAGSLLYRMLLWARRVLPKRKIEVAVPVVSVGNLSIGGAGKTPLVIELARYIHSKGKKVGIVSSGYGRMKKDDILGTGEEIRGKEIDETGDEVMMMAEMLPGVLFAVSRSKSNAAALLADRLHPEIIIVDDGFQHRRLHRDYDILLIDAGIDLRKEALFPLGRLREPWQGLFRADAFLMTKSNLSRASGDFADWVGSQCAGKLLVRAEFHNEEIISIKDRIPITSIRDKLIYFFAGIGSFNPLVGYLKVTLPLIGHCRRFPDHCRYNSRDINKIKKDIDRIKPDLIVTTGKDFIKLRHFDFGRPLYYLGLRIRFASGDQSLFAGLDGLVGN
jgi:tetraacyldisaccharide 4'-kinase